MANLVAIWRVLIVMIAFVFMYILFTTFDCIDRPFNKFTQTVYYKKPQPTFNICDPAKVINSDPLDLTLISTYGDLEAQLCKEKKELKLKGNLTRSKSAHCPSSGIVSMFEGGRTGNIIWEYISILMVSLYTGLDGYVPSCIKDKIDKIFEGTTATSFEEIEHCPVPKNMSFIVDASNWSTCPNQSIIIPRYYFQMRLTFQNKEGIIEELQFHRELRDHAQKSLQALLKGKEKKEYTFVGVHVRRTDYNKYVKLKYNKTLAKPSFFIHAMDYYKSKYSNCLFVYVSDDPPWCLENFKKLPDVVIMTQKERTPAQDLALMAACNHTIFDYGTFGHWSALLAGGDAVYYNLLDQNVSETKHDLKNWIMMD